MNQTELDIGRLKQICNALDSAEKFHSAVIAAVTDMGDPRVHEYGLARAQAEDMIEEIRSRRATPEYPRCPICNDDMNQCPKTYSGGNVGPDCPF